MDVVFLFVCCGMPWKIYVCLCICIYVYVDIYVYTMKWLN